MPTDDEIRQQIAALQAALQAKAAQSSHRPRFRPRSNTWVNPALSLNAHVPNTLQHALASTQRPVSQRPVSQQTIRPPQSQVFARPGSNTWTNPNAPQQPIPKPKPQARPIAYAAHSYYRPPRPLSYPQATSSAVSLASRKKFGVGSKNLTLVADNTHPATNGSQEQFVRRGNKLIRVGAGDTSVLAPRSRVIKKRKLTRKKFGRNRKLVRRKSKTPKYCLFFHLHGHCKNTPCRYIHDPKRIRLCPSLLQIGVCSNDHCKYNHSKTEFNTPHCTFYLQSKCTRPDCLFSHAPITKSEGNEGEVCPSFLKYRYCDKGFKCGKKHIIVCPEWEKTGTCKDFADGKCKYPHPPRKRTSVRPADDGNESGGESETDYMSSIDYSELLPHFDLDSDSDNDNESDSESEEGTAMETVSEEDESGLDDGDANADEEVATGEHEEDDKEHEHEHEEEHKEVDDHDEDQDYNAYDYDSKFYYGI